MFMAVNKLVIPLLLTLIIFFSIGLVPSMEWSEEKNEESSNNQNNIDYSLLQEYGLVDVDVNQYALSQSRDFAVLRVSFDDEPVMRYTRSETITLFNSVAQFYDEATYSGADLDFTILPDDGSSYNVGDQSLFNGGNFQRCQSWSMASAAVAAATSAGTDIRDFDGVIVIHSGDWEAGCSSGPERMNVKTTPTDNDEDGNMEGITWKVAGDGDASFTYVGENDNDPDLDVWGRIAHEVGHAMGLPHLAYEYQICHDVMGGSCAYPVLPSSWSRQVVSNPGLQSMDPDTEFTIVNTGVSEYTLADLNEDPNNLPSGLNHQVLKIPLSSDGSFYYLVEVRYETLSDALKPIPSEGVMIYRVNEWNAWNPDEDTVWEETDGGTSSGPVSNHGAVTVMDSSPIDGVSNAVWVGGDIFEDVDYGLKIEVKSLDNIASTALVEVTFNPTGTDPSDIHISPWGQPPGSPGPWESIDIWVDSRLNNNDVDGDSDADWDGQATDGTFAQSYKDSVTSHPQLPLGRGDMPWVDHVNRFYVEISNNGGTTLGNGMVKIKFQWKKPTAGGGTADSWSTIGTIICGSDAASANMQTGTGKCLESDDFPEQSTETNQILPLDSIIAYIEWTPSEDDFPDDSDIDASEEQTHKVHSCIRVVVEPVGDEPTINNNKAQENINYFETSPGSPYHSLNGTISVGNPFTTDVFGILSLNGLPSGWDANLSWTNGHLDPEQSFDVEWNITPEDGYALGQVEEVEFSLTYFMPDDETYSDHGHEYIFGGITNKIATVDKTLVDVTTTSQIPGVINVVGDLNPYGGEEEIRVFNGNTRISIILTSPDGTDYVASTSINSVGNFVADIQLLGMATDEVVMAGGQWTSRVYYDGDSHHRTAWGESQVVIVEPLLTIPDIDISLTVGDDFLASGTLPTSIYPATDLFIIYTSPSGEVFSSSVTVDASGKYSDSFNMNETGKWSVVYEYTDSEGNLQSWTESVDVEKESTGIPSVGLFTTSAILIFSAIISTRRRN